MMAFSKRSNRGVGGGRCSHTFETRNKLTRRKARGSRHLADLLQRWEVTAAARKTPGSKEKTPTETQIENVQQ